jgi:hypothetical protein
MMRTRTSFAGACLMATLAGPVSAQQPPQLAPGQLIRVTAAAAGLKNDDATLLGLTRDTLLIGRVHRHWYGGADTSRAAVTLRDVQSLEVSQGRASYWARGLLVGGIVGGVSGVLYGAVHGIDVTGSNAYCMSQGWAPGTPCSRLIPPGLGASLIGAAAGGAFGALIGLPIGASFHHERWRKVPLDQIRPVVVPQANGRLGLGVSLVF